MKRITSIKSNYKLSSNMLNIDPSYFRLKDKLLNSFLLYGITIYYQIHLENRNLISDGYPWYKYNK